MAFLGLPTKEQKSARRDVARNIMSSNSSIDSNKKIDVEPLTPIVQTSEKSYTIHTKLIKIDDILKDNLILDKVRRGIEEKSEEDAKRKKTEKDLEKGEPKDNKFKLPVPKQVKSMWGRIQQFFKAMFLGLMLTQLIKILPALLKILPLIASFVNWILDWGGKILNALITLVDWGYKAYDWTRNQVEKVFGEDGVEKFDKISGVLNTVLNHSMTIALGMIALSNEWNREDNERKKQQDLERKRTKDANRKVRNQEGTRTRTGQQHQTEVRRRLKNREIIKRNRRINRVRKAVGLEEVKPKLDTTPTGTRQKPVVETPETPKVKKTKIKPIVETPKVETPKVRIRKPKISTGPNIFQRTWSGAVDLGKGGIKNIRKGAQWTAEGTVSNWRKGRELWDSAYRNTVGRMDDWIKKNLDPSIILKKMAEEGGDGILPKVARGMLGMADSPLMKGLMRGLPFLGDAILFIGDVVSGKHWIRAFLRMLGAALIDAGFYALLAALGIAAPFTAGASLVGSAALVAAYMAADAVAGSALGGDAGVGQVIGDKIADYFGVPEMAGEKGAKDGMWEQAFGKGGSSSNKIIESVNKVQLTPEQIAKISKFPGGLGNKPSADTMSTEREVTGRFDMKTGTAYINEKEVSVDEYNKFINLSKKEKLELYGSSTGSAKILPLDVNSVSKTASTISSSASYDDNSDTVVVMVASDSVSEDENTESDSGGAAVITIDSASSELDDADKALYSG